MPQSITPSSSPPPPPRTGGGIYIIAVIALVAAIGALVCWKLKGNDGPVTTVPPIPTVTNAPTLAEPPPPPPPPIEEAVHVDGGQRVVANNSNPCGAKCTGKSNGAMESALTARAGAARPCYERALRVNSTLQGKLTVNIKIDQQGNVCSTSIAQDAIHSVEVSNCVMGMFRSAKFPPPSGGCAEVNVPLSFVPREGK